MDREMEMAGKASGVESLIDRVDRSGGEDACWPWTGSLDRQGYGRVRHVLIRTELAHRAVYQLLFGPLPDAVCVCHSCDNPCCCNPAHLWIGSIADNNRDMVAKGRNVPPTKAKLSPAQIAQIRRLSPRKTAAVRELAKSLGVGATTVRDVVSGATWKTLEQA